MATEAQGGASFNPDDASGLLDNIRGKITKVVVDFFTATKGKNAGSKFVQAAFTFEGQGVKHTENYMIGGADQWAPNATKTGAIALKEGGRVWNKSDIYAFIASVCNAEPKFKALIGADLSVLVGADVQLSRVTAEGSNYKDDQGVERTRTRLLVTKVYEMPKAGGAKGTKATATAKPTATSAPADTGDNDDLLTAILVEIVGESGGSVAKSALAPAIFIKATKRKVGAPVRAALQERAQDDAFLAGLAEEGLIQFDGTTLSAAA